MLYNIKNILIAVAITAFVTGIAISSVTWKYTSSHYKQIISEQQLAAQTELTKATNTVLEKERINAKITSDFNQKYLDQNKVISTAQANLDKLYRERGRMRVINSSCSTSSVAADTTASSDSSGTSSPSNGVCLLSGELSTFLAKVTYDADVLRATALTCKSYAEAIEKQRKDMSNNDNK